MTGRWLDPWPPLPIDVWLRRPRKRLPFPLDSPDCRLYSLARHGLWHGVRALDLQPGDEILVPAYHHGSEVEALLRIGLGVVFYGGGPDLAPDAAELEAAASPRTRALHLTHYLGFPQDAAKWRSFCDARGWKLLEDAAQSWLATSRGAPVGSVGDLAIFSLYKTFGIPDGAALVCSALPPTAPDGGQGGRGLATAAQLHERWLAQRLPVHRRAEPDADGYDAEADFALGDPNSSPSRAAAALLPRIADADAASARRARYLMLLDRFAGRVPEPFARLPDGASPWMFPIEVDDKERVRQRLAAAGIGTVDIWSVPHRSLETRRFPDVARRRAATLGLPVHQELRPSDVERIAATLAAVLG
jgi:dTDP-4-amino-4,6-dideoxygalactose transaminase